MQEDQNKKIVTAFLRACFVEDREKYIQQLSTDADWISLSTFLQQHNLTSFFYQAITSQKVTFEVPPAVLKNWSISTKKTIINNALLEQELGFIIVGLKELNVCPVLLKGLALHRIYDNILARPSSDIDLFIDRADYKAVRDYLLKNGFDYGVFKGFRGTREQFIELHENYFTEMHFLKELGSTAINIDLHWEMDGIYDGSPLEELFPIDKYSWHPYTLLDQWDGLSFNTLSPEMQFIHLAAHFAIHHQFQGAKWFLDLVLYIDRRGGELDWEFIDSVVREPDCRKIIGVTLRLIENLLISLPMEVPRWQHFWNGRGLPGEFSFYKKRIFADPSKTGQYLGNVLLPLKIRDKLKVLVYYLFNKEAISLWRTDTESGKVPNFMQPFYIIYRVYQDNKNKKPL